MYNIFNKSLLKQYHTPHYANQKLKGKHTQDEQQEDDDGDYKLEWLLNSCISKQGQGHGQLEYLVKWKNYPLEEAVKVAFISSCFHSMSLTQVT